MCQLSLVNLGNPMINKLFLSSMLQINAVSGNRDGTGFLSVTADSTSIFKTRLAGDGISDLGLILRDNITSSYPVLAHVRAASKGIVVTDDNAHPFSGKRFTLAHNGRLYDKDEVVSYYSSSDNTGLESDSLKFLEALEKVAKNHPEDTSLELLNKCMKNFKGKFALLIYDSVKDEFIVARGDSAELHMMEIFEEIEDKTKPDDQQTIKKSIGFIVNTKKNSLSDAAMISLPQAQIVTGKYLVAGDVTELKKNTVYKVDKKALVELGELKEVEVKYATYTDTKNKAITPVVNSSIPEWRYGGRIASFMEEHFLNIEDIDAMFYLFLGVSMAEIDVNHLNTFVAKVIPMLSGKKNHRKKLDHILRGGKIYPIVYYDLPGLQYPWMVNEDKEIDRMIKYLQEKRVG